MGNYVSVDTQLTRLYRKLLVVNYEG